MSTNYYILSLEVWNWRILAILEVIPGNLLTPSLHLFDSFGKGRDAYLRFPDNVLTTANLFLVPFLYDLINLKSALVLSTLF